jgi:hypothetical protein
MSRSMDRVREAIAPYTRFVRAQNEHLEVMRSELAAVDNDMRALRYRIGAERTISPGVKATVLPSVSDVWLPRGPSAVTDGVIEAEHRALPGRSDPNSPVQGPDETSEPPEIGSPRSDDI